MTDSNKKPYPSARSTHRKGPTLSHSAEVPLASVGSKECMRQVALPESGKSSTRSSAAPPGSRSEHLSVQSHPRWIEHLAIACRKIPAKWRQSRQYRFGLTASAIEWPTLRQARRSVHQPKHSTSLGLAASRRSFPGHPLIA